MSMDPDRTLKAKLLQLECHFTWALTKDDIDLNDVLNRLEEQINLDLEKKGRLARIYSALAYVQFLLGFHERANNSLMTSIQLHMECHGDEFQKALIVTYGNLAWLNYDMKNYTECESYLKKLEKISEAFPVEFASVPEVLGEKGWTFLKFSTKYYDRAKECFRKAFELEPEDGEWNTGYAIALYRTENGSLEDSPTVKQLRRAIDMNPDDDVLKALLSLRLIDYNRSKEAESLVEKALERSPDHPHVMRYVEKFFHNLDCVDRSIALLTRVLKHSPNSSFIHYQLALCYKWKKVEIQHAIYVAKGFQQSSKRVQEIRDECIYHLEKATSLRTSFISAMSELAQLYGENREMSRAEKLFQVTFKTAEEKKDNLDVVHYHYAVFQLYCHRCEPLAVKHFMECLKVNPKSSERKRSASGLRKIAQKRIERNYQEGEAYGILAFVHKEKGEIHQAIECYEKALSYEDNDEFLSNLTALRLSLQ